MKVKLRGCEVKKWFRDRTRHLAPEHWGEKARTKKLAERIAEKRDQRKVIFSKKVIFQSL